jgi:hypothetical protein
LLSAYIHNNNFLKEFEKRFLGFWQGVARGVWGGKEGGGPEEVFGRWEINAVTIFGNPSEGPYGFYDIGRCVFPILFWHYIKA